MTRPILYTLTSSLHGEMASDPRQEPFIREIEAALGEEFDCRGDDFSSFAGFLYIRTGGTEGLFLEKFARPLGLIPGAPEPDSHPEAGKKAFPGANPPSTHPEARDELVFRLLASGQSNSLAAAMEILSWLRQRGIPGEILHGSPAAIAARIRTCHLERNCHLERSREILRQAQDDMDRILEGKRFGVIGRPSDWLISSGVDYAAAREKLGAELIDIPIEELVAEAKKGKIEQKTPPIPGQPFVIQGGRPENTSSSGTTRLPDGQMVATLKPLNAPKYGRKIDEKDWDGALAIYDALKALVARYRLNGLTLRCFDLLTALHNTGCLALAMLNAEGITATCEGDIPAMLSMAVARALTGRSSFQVNLSRIEGDRLLFAHCTVPLDIVQDYCYDTHFESGIGVAIHGLLPEGPVTLFKISPDFRRVYRREARIVANPYGDNLCRTQVIVEAPGAAAYFLQQPIGNHHIIVPGTL